LQQQQQWQGNGEAMVMATMAREAAQAQPINEHSNPVISAIDVAMLQGLDLQ